MIFEPPLASGVLLRRYKRFLADIEIASDAEAASSAHRRPRTALSRKRMTIHCANTGAMTGCAAPGSPVWYSTSANPRRKYPHTLELVRDPAGDLIGVNTARANGVVAEALLAGLLPAMPRPPEYSQPLAGRRVFLQREVRIAEAVAGETGRFDLRAGEVFVEVKTVTLKLPGTREGAFPDAVSVRATRHVEALTAAVRGGRQAALVFCVLHAGIASVRPADEIDPAYGTALRIAAASGVRVRALACRLSPRGIMPVGPLPVLLQPPRLAGGRGAVTN